MKTISKYSILVVLIALSLSSCFVQPKSQMVVTSSNPEIKVELLFEVDGCKVYRFYDNALGQPRYFTKCKDSSSVGWIEPCGKSCTYYAENMTGYEKEAFGIPKNTKKTK